MGFQFDALQDHTELHAGLEQDTAVEQAKEANELHELFNPVGFLTTNHNSIIYYSKRIDMKYVF